MWIQKRLSRLLRHLKVTYGKAISYEEYASYSHKEMTEIMYEKVKSQIQA